MAGGSAVPREAATSREERRGFEANSLEFESLSHQPRPQLKEHAARPRCTVKSGGDRRNGVGGGEQLAYGSVLPLL